jgi:hypothetical protein
MGRCGMDSAHLLSSKDATAPIWLDGLYLIPEFVVLSHCMNLIDPRPSFPNGSQPNGFSTVRSSNTWHD